MSVQPSPAGGLENQGPRVKIICVTNIGLRSASTVIQAPFSVQAPFFQ